MRIREATHEDQEGFSDLYHLHYSDNDDVKAEPVPFEYTNFRNFLLVAEDNGKLIGFIWGYFLALGIRRYGYVEDLFIMSAHRKQGIAASLLTVLKKKFKELDVDSVFVTTEKDNKEAISLYLKEDFNLCSGPWFYWAPD